MVVDRKKRQQNVDSNSAYLVNRRLNSQWSLRANGTFLLQRLNFLLCEYKKNNQIICQNVLSGLNNN